MPAAAGLAICGTPYMKPALDLHPLFLCLMSLLDHRNEARPLDGRPTRDQGSGFTCTLILPFLYPKAEGYVAGTEVGMPSLSQ